MAEYKIEGWVARDGEMIGDTDLYFGTRRPERGYGVWLGLGNYLELPKEMFSTLKWEDEPIKVELTIKEDKQ
ncbi:MAG: hypothetical protein IKN59_01760 [Paludibacteraceae bacterium]|nr:hypothetical protein [Paludibacteraceae bacterium]